MVGLDLYVNETTAHCDYVLPVTTMYERDDFAVTFQTFQATPFRQATEAVVAPAGETRTEWDIIAELTERMAGRAPTFAVMGLAKKLTGMLGRRFTPRPFVDAMIRMSAGGNRFGLRRGGLTFRRLTERHPHGVVVAPHLRTGVLDEVVAYNRGRVRLEHEDIAAEIIDLSRRNAPVDFPMRVIGMREPRSENSWMHNAPLLMRGDRIHRALMHLDDAAARHIGEGDTVAVRSPYGQIALPVSLTADIVPGTIAVPHGWGHKGTGGWKLANRAGGANVNQLMSSDPARCRGAGRDVLAHRCTRGSRTSLDSASYGAKGRVGRAVSAESTCVPASPRCASWCSISPSRYMWRSSTTAPERSRWPRPWVSMSAYPLRKWARTFGSASHRRSTGR